MARAERSAIWLRIVSALVLAPPALAAAWLGGVWLAALVVLLAAGMGWEWARLAGAGPRAGLVAAAAALPPLAMACGWDEGALVLVAIGAAAVWTAVDRARRPVAPWAALGMAWIALPCMACLWLDRVGGRFAILWLFATVWATDTGAYIAGRGIGGPRVAPRLSPNKTWAGVAGGLAAAALVAWLAAYFGRIPAAVLIPAGLGLGLASQLGDLAESAAKRRFGVKDSGSVIPGHGGLLDRLDGMLTAAAFAWLLLAAGGVELWR